MLLRIVSPLVVLVACQTPVTSPAPLAGDDPSGAYEALLGRVVTPDGFVRWAALEEDHAALDAYVAWLARPGALPEDHDAAHATWLNAYNAWTLYGVLDTGVPASVKAVPGWLPREGSGFFLERTYDLGGRRVSLYTAEHTWIRGEFHDWRDHAALNCASASCPPLRRELYHPERLEAQLDDQVRRWVDDPVRGWKVEGDTGVFNPIFSWFAGDFPATDAGLCGLLGPYAVGERQRALETLGATGCPHRFFEYDWRLNHPPRGGKEQGIE